MFKRILIVLDPLVDVPPLLDRGVALARSADAEVVFYSGLQRYRAPAADMPDGEMATQWAMFDDLRARAEGVHLLASQAAQIRGLMTLSLVATTDDPLGGILEAALTSRCDMILATSEGSNAVMRLLTGNVIPGLVTSSPLPVMVCAPITAPAVSADGCPRRILVVLDEADPSRAALKQGLAMARGHAELLLVHVVPPELMPVIDLSGFAAGAGESLAAQIQLQSRRLLAAAGATARKAGLKSRAVRLPSGTTARDIARLALDGECDLIVVGHRGSNAVIRLLTGSLIPGLITAATVPVLICRGAGAPAGAVFLGAVITATRPQPQRQRRHHAQAEDNAECRGLRRARRCPASG